MVMHVILTICMLHTSVGVHAGTNIHQGRFVHRWILGSYTGATGIPERQPCPRGVPLQHPSHDCWDHRRPSCCDHHATFWYHQDKDASKCCAQGNSRIPKQHYNHAACNEARGRAEGSVVWHSSKGTQDCGSHIHSQWYTDIHCRQGWGLQDIQVSRTCCFSQVHHMHLPWQQPRVCTLWLLSVYESLLRACVSY